MPKLPLQKKTSVLSIPQTLYHVLSSLGVHGVHSYFTKPFALVGCCAENRLEVRERNLLKEVLLKGN